MRHLFNGPVGTTRALQRMLCALWLCASAAAAAEGEAPEPAVAFSLECLQPLKQREKGAALAGCSRFLALPPWAAKAHSALSSVHALSPRPNPPESARHAAEAARLGDATAKFFLAHHLLSGEAGLRPDLGKARALLGEAQAQGVEVAGRFAALVDASVKCRTESGFRLLGNAYFCMFRPEVQALLKASGMQVRSESTAGAPDSYRPGALVESASVFEVHYDRDPEEALLRPALMLYRFGTNTDKQVLDRISVSLASKYGRPTAGTVPTPPGARTQWRSADGIDIVFARDAVTELRYEHPARHKAMVENQRLARQRQMEQQTLRELRAM